MRTTIYFLGTTGDDGVSTAVVVGAVIGSIVVVVVAIIVLVVLVLMWRKYKNCNKYRYGVHVLCGYI